MTIDEMVKKFETISRTFGEVTTAPQIVIRMRNEWAKDSRFYAMFDKVWVAEGDRGGAVRYYGNGSTPEEAMQDYLQKISGKTLIYNINRSNEISVVVVA